MLRELREGRFDALVGVNLLREGLDLPEVSLVAILDADKEGFLRSETSLIQTIGRAARNVNAKVILYADRVTNAMKNAIDETRRRRRVQEEYNREHGITPETIRKSIRSGIEAEVTAHRQANAAVGRTNETEYVTQEYINELEAEMLAAAEALEFETRRRLARPNRAAAGIGGRTDERSPGQIVHAQPRPEPGPQRQEQDPQAKAATIGGHGAWEWPNHGNNGTNGNYAIYQLISHASHTFPFPSPHGPIIAPAISRFCRPA